MAIEVGENESAKYWLPVLDSLKNRGVKDILILCADGLTGIREAITAAYLKTEYQCCFVHQVRNTMKYVSDKDRKPSIRHQRKKKHWMPWNELLKNGAKNIPIP